MSATYPPVLTATREQRLLERRLVLKDYLHEAETEEDWHGVMDAAADLREVDAELRGLARG